MRLSTVFLSLSVSTMAASAVDAAFMVQPSRSSISSQGAYNTCRTASSCFESFLRATINSEILSESESTESAALATSIPEKSETFVNTTPMKWMNPYLDSLGIKEGKTITYGVFAKDLESLSTPVSEPEAARLRTLAADKLENIGMEERQRRDQSASVLWKVTFLYAMWSSLFADDGGIYGHFVRFLVILPLFLALGYQRSAEKGVCNIAQAGLWDVDGNGLQKIEDPSIAQAILDKVNAMNTEVGVAGFVGAAIFGSLPQSTTAPLGFVAALGTALYLLQGRIPDELD